MKTLGIIGGMGPLATVDLMEKIVLSTQAAADQEHIHILVDNNTNIPDRTACIMGSGPSPVPELVKSAERLTREGADVLIMGCNTAHYFLPQMRPHLTVPVVNMIEETAKYCQEKGLHCVGLLASAGTYGSHIYEKAFGQSGVTLINPKKDEEEFVHEIIYQGVKANNPDYDTKAFRAVLTAMKGRGAEAFIMGCTEIPLAMKIYHIDEPCIDATQILAEKAIEFVGGTCIHK